jgi:hypothetical protein
VEPEHVLVSAPGRQHRTDTAAAQLPDRFRIGGADLLVRAEQGVVKVDGG